MARDAITDWRGFQRALICVVMIAVAVSLYGLVRYPDAPFRECSAPSGSCGKSGSPHTAEEYRGFIAWQTTLMFIGPAAMLAAFFLYRRKR